MAEHTTAAHTSRLTELRRLDSADKARRVLAALDATISAGEPLTIAALARRAGAITADAQVTAASLRADLANARAANHRQHTELEALRRRLGQILGHEILADLGDAPAEPVDPRIEQLTDALAQTNKELAHRGEELAAARQINRELIARLNREH